MIIEAYDDGYFPPAYKARRGRTVIVGITVEKPPVIRSAGYVAVTVDGRESTGSVISLSKILGGDLVMLDGITYAGFDIVDPYLVHEATGKPVIVVQYAPLDPGKIKHALFSHFVDAEERYRVIEKALLEYKPVSTPWRTVRLLPVGISFEEAVKLVRSYCVYSPIPEPLRIADKLASQISKLLLIKL